MTNWEDAIAHWLPNVWTPGRRGIRRLYGSVTEWEYHPTHPAAVDIPCPPPSRELGFRLLEAMVDKGFQPSICYAYETQDWGVGIEFVDDELGFVKALPDVIFDADLLTALTKAAAALAEKEQL